MADPKLAVAVGALHRALKRAGGRHMLIGGVAIIARGVRRLTDDVDAALWAEDVQIDTLLRHLAAEGIVPRIRDVAAFARKSQVVLLRHERSGIDIDLSLAWLPFESAALDRADTMDIGRSRVRVAKPDDLIVYKAIAARERDRSDVERLLEIHGATIDLPRVKRTVGELAEALERPELARELEALVQKVLAPRRRARPKRASPKRGGRPGRWK